jgi:hypothetical protein
MLKEAKSEEKSIFVGHKCAKVENFYLDIRFFYSARDGSVIIRILNVSEKKSEKAERKRYWKVSLSQVDPMLAKRLSEDSKINTSNFNWPKNS